MDTGAGDEHRTRDIVFQVLQEALRVRHLEGVVIGAPPGPEASLLLRWLDPGIRTVPPPGASLSRLVDALEGDTEAAHLAWAAARARRDRLLVVHPAHKSMLLLDAPLAPCFPLGDLWAHQLQPWSGGVSRPRILMDLEEPAFRAVEDALSAGLERGVGLRRSLQSLPPGCSLQVRRRLATARAAAAPPLVPKLSAWTPGLDPRP